MPETQKGWMIDPQDKARFEIVRRAQALGLTGDPDRAAHALGPVVLADGRTVNAHVVHAVDAIITDGKDVAMINRSHEPGIGKPALPGGLIDPLPGGGVETSLQAAIREAQEEVGVKLGAGILIGLRNMERPYDVRVARGKGLEAAYGIGDGDVFMVSTQGVRFDVADLSKTHLVAGDDAEPGSARRVAIATITRESVGIPDHADMVHQALAERSRGVSSSLSAPGLEA